MAKVKLDLEKKNTIDKIAMGRKVLRSIRTSPYFFKEGINTTELETAIIQLEHIYQHEADQQYDILEIMEMEYFLDEKLEQTSKMVEKLSRGNSTIITSSGFECENHCEQLKQLRKLNSTCRNDLDEVDIKWKRVYGAKAYLIEISTTPDDPESWKKIGHSLRSQYTCFNLNKKEKYYIRVSVLGENKQIISSKVQRLIAA